MAVSRKIKESMEQGSMIRRMFEQGAALRLERGAENVFDLSLGNPVVEPPAAFFAELRRLADSPEPGMHRYMPNAGYVETRAAVAAQLAEETGLALTHDEVVMTVGAGGALNVVLKTLLNPGDEVVVFAPYFVEYLFYADNHGGSCRVVPPDDMFLPDLDAFEASINRSTKVVLINSPNNPTGVVYDAGLLARLGEIIETKERQLGTEIFLLSDEPYRRVLFDGLEYPHVFHHHRRSIVATSHSKDLALPGERIGYIAVHPDYGDKGELMDGIIFCNRTLGFVNAPALMQRIVARLQSETVDVGGVPGQARFLVWTASEHALRCGEAAGGLLHVSQVAHRRRRKVRRRADGVRGAGRSRRRVRSARAFPHLLLRRGQDPGGRPAGLPSRHRTVLVMGAGTL